MKILNNHKKRSELGISPNEAIILDTLNREWFNGSITMLSKLVSMNDQTARTIVKRLIEKGYIESKPMPNYKERKKIRLSKKYLDSLE